MNKTTAIIAVIVVLALVGGVVFYSMNTSPPGADTTGVTVGTNPTPTQGAPIVNTQIPSVVATTTATLHGSVNPQGAVTTYWFEYSTDSLYGSSTVKTTSQNSIGLGTDTVSLQADISALQSKSAYYYRIVAQNSSGIVRGDSVTFTTK